jgi:hypothetical protein
MKSSEMSFYLIPTPNKQAWRRHEVPLAQKNGSGTAPEPLVNHNRCIFNRVYGVVFLASIAGFAAGLAAIAPLGFQ